MIDEVMYGMIPRAKTASCVSAPPENRLMNESALFCIPWENCCAFWTSMPGVGMCAPSL
jgi:hypothetical protein